MLRLLLREQHFHLSQDCKVVCASTHMGHVPEGHEISRNTKPLRKYNYVTDFFLEFIGNADLTEEWNMQKAATMFPSMDCSTQIFHLPVSAPSRFCLSKRTLRIYIPYFFQMCNILIQTWKSKLFNAPWRISLTLCFTADVSEPQSSEMSCLQLPKIFREWNENHFDFQSFIQPPASLLLTQPHILWAKICDVSYRDENRFQSFIKIYLLSCLPLPKFRLQLSLERFLV